MHQKYILTHHAPAPGNYSQAVKVDIGAGYFVYVSGETGNNPQDKECVREGGIRPQTRQALVNIEKILEATGARIQHIVQTTVALENMQRDKTGFEYEYQAFFEARGKRLNLPARFWIEAKVPLPEEETIVMIGAVAYVPKTSTPKK